MICLRIRRPISHLGVNRSMGLHQPRKGESRCTRYISTGCTRPGWVLRTEQWTDSVNRKLKVMVQNYSLLVDEVNIQHSNFLEWIIIMLIALEFGFAILTSFWQ